MSNQILYSGPNGAVSIAGPQNVSVSSNYTVQPFDYTVTSTGAGSFTITLLSAVPYASKNIIIRCLSTASITVQAAAGEFIDTVTSKVLINGEVLDITSDGTKWVDTAGSVISGSKIANGTITASKLSSNSVTADKIASNSVTADKIASNSVTADKIASDSVTADKIATGAVGTSEINTNAEPTVSTIYSTNWFRSYGNTGWYNQTYGGGWYMNDSSAIRTYNNVGVLASFLTASPGAVNADGGFTSYSGKIETTIGAIKGGSFECTNGTSKMICAGMSAVFPGTSTGCELSLRGNEASLTFGLFRPYSFSWQSDRNVVLYSGSTALWSTGTSTSDIKTKENIQKYKNSGIDVINNLNVVEFNYIKEIDEQQTKRVGFIAQQIEKIISYAVKSVGPDEKNQTLILYKEEIVPYLVKAAQEQQEQIKSLEERIKKLEELINKGT